MQSRKGQEEAYKKERFDIINFRIIYKPVILLRKQSALIKKNIKLSPLSTGESKL